MRRKATMFAILAAAFYAINVPLSKVLMAHIEPTMMAAFLYLGAGVGLLLYSFICKMLGKETVKEPLTRKELPYTVAMVVLDIIAPILLMFGITKTNSANVSLLNNFEIVATTLIAFFIFKEVISKRLRLAIILVTVASIILGFEGAGSFSFNAGSLLVLGACICWGFENNCTKMLSSKSSIEIVMIKGCFSGLGSLVIALLTWEQIPGIKWIFAALVIMVVATILMIKDTITLQHTHQHAHTHTHEHRHGDLVHTHEHTHYHTHTHVHEGNEELHTHHHKDLEGHNHLHAV